MTDAGERPFSVNEDGSTRLAVRVTPRAKRNELAGVVDADGGRIALSIRLAAPPVEGAANRALVDFLADGLEVPKSSVRIVSGEASRLKIVRIEGVTEATVRRLL